LKQFDAAIVEFKQAEKDTPNDPMVHYYLGTSEEQVGKLDDAVDQFTKAQSLAKPGTQVYQYATAALASARQYARDPRYKKKPTGKDQSTLSPDAAARDAASKQLAQAERRAQDIEAHAEEEARRMSVATIRIGNMTVKRYTNEDLDEVRLEARDKAEGIRREAHQRYQSISATAPASSSITSPPGTRATITSPNRTAATAAGMSHPATQANQKPH
jgi:tetratricopeptide (TPR) repeat protein